MTMVTAGHLSVVIEATEGDGLVSFCCGGHMPGKKQPKVFLRSQLEGTVYHKGMT